MRGKACPQCHTTVPLEAQQCGACGHLFQTQVAEAPADQTQAFNAPPAGAPPSVAAPDQPDLWYPPTSPGKGLAIASMVCGIVSFLAGCIWWWPVSLPFAIAGIALAVAGGLRSPSRGMAVAGLATSILGLCSVALFLPWIIAVLAGRGY
jgi:hypothetical protein